MLILPGTTVQEALAGFEAEHVVPGHGLLAGRSDLPEILARHERYYRFVLDAATKGRERGLAPLAAAQEADLGELAEWADAERLVLNCTGPTPRRRAARWTSSPPSATP
ncbi:hypothetical protein ACQEVF_24335 [Nonomuraea polychroma]|uniref:hypothetical protein n=1 Tax=Nonomuraea polychroma TaxID=46176 RepID=UPI003D911D62